MMYPHYYGSQLVHSPATPNSVSLFNSSPMTTATTISPPTPTSSRAVKRAMSDDSTDDELDSSHKSMQMADSNMDGNCHLISRKKRRGLIEKRRRDRINNSLHELKRLVPAAFEKQGSAKLEKAEILQLTVDHLRMLHSKGFDAFSFDPHKFATDYHVIGFRECAAEVARYLVVHEGIDFQDPLRLRLISHLQCYSAQRELSLKSSTGWNPSLFTTPMYPPPPPTMTSSQSSSIPSTSSASISSSSLQSSTNTCDTMSLHNSSSHHNSYSSTYYPQQSLLDNSMMSSSNSVSSMNCQNSSLQPQHSNSKSPSVMSSSTFSLGYSSVTPTASVTTISTPPSSSSSYSYSYPTGSYFGPSATYMTPMVPTSSNNVVSQSNSQSSVKHYRPWGTELAY